MPNTKLTIKRLLQPFHFFDKSGEIAPNLVTLEKGDIFIIILGNLPIQNSLKVDSHWLAGAREEKIQCFVGN